MDSHEKQETVGETSNGAGQEFEDVGPSRNLPGLPGDLPRTLDDRKSFPGYSQETEYYDAWQGQSQFLSAPTMTQPLNFNLSLHEPDEAGIIGLGREYGHDDVRAAQMLAAQGTAEDSNPAETQEEDVLQDRKLSREQKAQALHDLLFMAASNGDAARVHRLVRGPAAEFVRLDKVDSEGTPPLIYASCFGHKDVVMSLLDAGATVDNQDRNEWTALMWAITNRHKEIAKTLLDHGASTDIKSSSGRTALDFVPPNSEMSDFLQHSGYSIGSAGVADDFYNSGFSQDRFEEELAESEMRRRMMMESAINLEVDLGNLGLDEQTDSADELDEGQDFVWDRCLNDQMFVFMEEDVERMMDVVVTNMTPQRSPTQKPVPANVIFLGARYAHYHSNRELLNKWLVCAQEKVYSVVDRHQWDMTMQAFWISNVTLLIHYLKKDSGLSPETTNFQAQMAELLHEIYILIIRDAERRMDKVLDSAMLDHETIPGFEDIHFQNEWSFLRSKKQVKPEPVEKRFRPPSPKRKAQVSPRNITSLLSSTLFVLDLYDVHSVLSVQALSQLYYWLNAEVFNRIMSDKKYLARTKAMQIRMNVSMLEDWARTNNRQPDHFENGMTTATGEPTVEAARRHLAPVVQLLQWLQCFSSLGEDKEAMETTLQQLPSLTTKQLLHAVKHYRAEVGEKSLSKASLKFIQEVKSRPKSANLDASAPQTPLTPSKGDPLDGRGTPQPPDTPRVDEDEALPQGNLLNPAKLLPFHLPTSTDMLISYGAGFGGMNRERERRYTPSVPHDFLVKLDPSTGQKNVYEGVQFSDSS